MKGKKKKKKGRKIENRKEGKKKRKTFLRINNKGELNSGTKSLSEKIFVCIIPLVRLSSPRLELDFIHLCVAHPRDYLG